MKIIRYQIPAYTWVWNEETQRTERQACTAEIEVPYSEEAYRKAQETAVGEVTVEGEEEEPTPTQLDLIEAQVTYTAMMTDTLLEV